ncbi:serum amyloid A-3 protein-like [Mercenaria mercenaria]|uniref:serum amyloid A-3 protein-like n=1 Tax=Mercenaria mercenaria TaxID=6596 RepID=UPI001E1DA67F|nr:serum amyloid A-3 protein-like [Mercenaria mercenaria]
MELTIRLLAVLVIFVLITSTTEAWWGSRSGSSSRTSSSSSSGGSSSSSGGGSSSSNSGGWLSRTWNYAKDFAGGTKDMAKAYSDMREANYKNSDKYFHARGNYDAANRGPGGKKAAEIISDLREWTDKKFKGDSSDEIAADQEANEWGRKGGDPNKYRPEGLPDKYKKK